MAGVKGSSDNHLKRAEPGRTDPRPLHLTAALQTLRFQILLATKGFNLHDVPQIRVNV